MIKTTQSVPSAAAQCKRRKLSLDECVVYSSSSVCVHPDGFVAWSFPVNSYGEIRGVQSYLWASGKGR
jgi:hypothetical protein